MRRTGTELDITTQFYHSPDGQLFRVADVVGITTARALKPKQDDCARNEDPPSHPEGGGPRPSLFQKHRCSTSAIVEHDLVWIGRKHRGGAAMGYFNGLNVSFEEKPVGC